MRTLALMTALLLAGACGHKAPKAETGTTAGSSTTSPDNDHDKSTDESVKDKDKDKDDKTDEAAKKKDKDADHDVHDDEGPAKK